MYILRLSTDESETKPSTVDAYR